MKWYLFSLFVVTSLLKGMEEPITKTVSALIYDTLEKTLRKHPANQKLKKITMSTSKGKLPSRSPKNSNDSISFFPSSTEGDSQNSDNKCSTEIIKIVDLRKREKNRYICCSPKHSLYLDPVNGCYFFHTPSGQQLICETDNICRNCNDTFITALKEQLKLTPIKGKNNLYCFSLSEQDDVSD